MHKEPESKSAGLLKSTELQPSSYKSFSKYWRSYLHITNTILRYYQYRYLVDQHSLSYYDYWRQVNNIIDCLLLKLKQAKIENAFEDQLKKEDITFLTQYAKILQKVFSKKIAIITSLPKVPNQEPDLQYDSWKSFETRFDNLLYFYSLVYPSEQLTPNQILEINKNMFAEIWSQQSFFEKFVQKYSDDQPNYNYIRPFWRAIKKFLNCYFSSPILKEDIRNRNSFKAFLYLLLDQEMLQRKLRPKTRYLRRLSEVGKESKVDLVTCWSKCSIDKSNLSSEAKSNSDKFNSNKSKSNNSKNVCTKTNDHGSYDAESIFLIIVLDIKFDLKTFMRENFSNELSEDFSMISKKL